METSQHYRETTRGITVTVLPSVVTERSRPDELVYVFSYQVTLENESSEIVQLINRHWRVFAGRRQIADVKGEGVVGEQPVLEPGVVFQYSSWTVLDDPSGYMEGIYTFRSERGGFFDVVIPRFDLLYVDVSAVH